MIPARPFTIPEKKRTERFRNHAKFQIAVSKLPQADINLFLANKCKLSSQEIAEMLVLNRCPLENSVFPPPLLPPRV